MKTDPTGWITAGATALTALFAGTGGLATWLALRREAKRDLPIVERIFAWEDDHLIVELVIRNRLPEIMILDEIRLLQPRGGTISKERGDYITSQGRVGSPTRGDSPVIRRRYEFWPAGSSVAPDGSTRLSFALWPPAGWRGGSLKLRLRISSKAETIRNKRIVINRRVPAAPRRQTEDAARNVG